MEINIKILFLQVRIKAKCLFWSQVTQLAKACTHENPQMRPSMRSIVVALMTLSSSTEDWDVGSFYENKALVNLMSGR
jgi:chitin elicitor receptor kinase 1